MPSRQLSPNQTALFSHYQVARWTEQARAARPSPGRHTSSPDRTQPAPIGRKAQVRPCLTAKPSQLGKRGPKFYAYCSVDLLGVPLACTETDAAHASHICQYVLTGVGLGLDCILR